MRLPRLDRITKVRMNTALPNRHRESNLIDLICSVKYTKALYEQEAREVHWVDHLFSNDV